MNDTWRPMYLSMKVSSIPSRYAYPNNSLTWVTRGEPWLRDGRNIYLTSAQIINKIKADERTCPHPKKG
jgi:hypothetical protein